MVSVLVDKKAEIKEKFAMTFNDLVKYDSSNTQKLEKIIEVWYEVYNSKVRVYSTLSAHFYFLKPGFEAGENVEIVLRNITLLEGIVMSSDRDDLKEFSVFIDKIRDHIELIGIQVNRMDVGVEQINVHKEDLSQNIHKMKNELNELSDRINGLKGKQEKSLQKAKKVQKEFVTILGIFATILITTFGGLTSLASIFNNINNASTGKLILLGSFVIFTVLLIVFLLLNGISKLSELNIRSCGCEVNSICNCSIARKHPTLYMVATILTLTSLVGISEYVIDYKEVFANSKDFDLAVCLVIVLTCISFFSFVYYLITKNKKPV